MAAPINLPVNAPANIDTPSTGRYNLFLNSSDSDQLYKKDSSGVSTAVVIAGTVTSVSFTGGIVSVATATTTPALTIAGTSGGIPYFSSGTTWASSAALAANSIVIGGGAGVAPSTITTGTGVITALGVNVGSAGAFVVNGGALGTPSSGTLTNCTGLVLTTGVTGVLPTANGGTGVNIATTALTLGTASTTVGSIVLQNATNANTITIQSGVTSASHTLTLPTAQGGANTYLKNDGAGALSWAAVASGAAISGLTLATASNTIDNTNYAQEWQWSTLAAGNGLKLSSISTAAASNTQTLFNIALSGANGTAAQTTYGLQVSNTHTGTTSTNIAGYFVASGGATRNWSLYTSGSVTIGTPNTTDTTSANGLQIEGGVSMLELAGRRRFQITYATQVNLLTINEDLRIDASYQNIFFQIGSSTKAQLSANGLYIGSGTASARLHISAGSASASTAPIKLNTGTVNTTAEAGAIEYNNTFHLTNSDATRRHVVTAPNTTKVTAGAPYTNDGYVVINIGGVDFKVMTTA